MVKTSIANKIKFQCEKNNINLEEGFYVYLEKQLKTTNKICNNDIYGLCENFLIPYATYNTISDYDEFTRRYYEFCTHGRGVTITKLKLKYGDVEGLIRWNTYCNKQSETNTLDYKSKKYGMTEEEFKEYNSSRSVTKENLVKRHGIELGMKKWNAYVERQSYAGCKLEYFIEKYGEEKGTLKYNEVNKQKILSYENFIRKYGDEDGKDKWESYLSNSRNLYSNISQELFDILADKLKVSAGNCFYAKLNYEKYLYNLTKSYKYDFCLEDKKLIIEYNGDLYHANPNIYSQNDVIKLRYLERPIAKDIWDYDAIKNKFAEDAGYKVLVVWESDYKNNKEKVINELLEVINNEPIK